MKIVLDISTLLGGLAAIWFLWDKFAAIKASRAAKRGGNLQSSELRKTILAKSERMSQIAICSIGGVFSGVMAEKYGSVGIVLYGWGALFLSLIYVIVTEWTNWGNKHSDTPFIVSAFLVIWGVSVGNSFKLIEYLTGTLFSGLGFGLTISIAGGIVGLMLGASKRFQKLILGLWG